MDFHLQRKLKFKAWNSQDRLLMRLNSIECVKGELVKKGHVLLQFTGLQDKQNEELYELDVMLIGTEQYVIVWNADAGGWYFQKLPATDKGVQEPFVPTVAQQALRLWSYFESAENA
ncbi:MAG TPA: YopX family protein [Ohtaekwangia sp.]|nr:YopX family protein [Ohtaekwangia sp.]